jgi:hypothetical protein
MILAKVEAEGCESIALMILVCDRDMRIGDGFLGWEVVFYALERTRKLPGNFSRDEIMCFPQCSPTNIRRLV